MLKVIKIFLLLLPLSCYALESDRDLPMQLAADVADINNHTGIGQYQGRVTLDQGSTHLTATRAVTYTNNKNQLLKAQAFGSNQQPVHYWTLTSPTKPEMHAYATTIEFYPPQHLIYLIGNAKVTQGKDSYTAPVITYNTTTQHISSSRDAKQRTTIIIHPQKEQPKKS